MIKNNSRNWALGAGTLLALFLLYYFRTVVSYIIIAWILSLLGQPIMTFLLKRTPLGRLKAGRYISAFLVLLIFIFAVIIYALIFIPLIIHQVDILSNVDYNALGHTLAQPYAQFKQWMFEHGLLPENSVDPKEIQSYILSLINPSKLASGLASFLFGLKDVLVGLFSVFFITFFFLKEQGLFMKLVKTVVPQENESQVEEAIKEATYLLTRYFGGELMRMISMVSFIFLALSLLGIRNALFIAFFAGIINIIPYVGSFMGAILGLFVTMTNNIYDPFSSVMLPKLIKVACVFLSAQLLDNFVLQPIIFSSRIKAHPLEIFLVFLVGAQIGGLFGMLIAIPSYTVLRVIGRVFFSHFKVIRQLTGKM